MTVKWFVPRPGSFPLTCWKGDNLEELEEFYETKFNVNLDGSLNLACMPFNQGDLSVPVGHWFSPRFMGSLSPEDVDEQLQEAPKGKLRLELTAE